MTSISGKLEEYDPSSNESKPTTAFIDLASFDNIEKALYGGPKAITYFIRETVRSSWFTTLPVKLQADTVNPDFGETFTVTISREGDYLLNSWLRLSLGAVSIYNPTNGAWINTPTSGSETITWTPNFMHNLVEKCTLKVNGQVLDEIYSEHLDFLSAFMVPKGSRIGYNRMVGNFTNPYGGMAGVNVSGYQAGNDLNVNHQHELFLPLPFFFSKDSGLALPMTSLPYNTVTMEFKFRDWRKLLGSIDTNGNITSVNVSQINQTSPKLYDVQAWGNYAIVGEKERKKINCLRRDMLIERNEQLGGSHGSVNLNTHGYDLSTSVDLRFNNSVKTLFFSARNTSGSQNNPYRSNYTTQGLSASDITVCRLNVSGAVYTLNNTANATASGPLNYQILPFNENNNDRSGIVWRKQPSSPFDNVKLVYENSLRMNMEPLYYRLIQSYQHARNVPDSSVMGNVYSIINPSEVSGQPALSIGYHMYSYSLKVKEQNPNGATNYDDLKNASLVFTSSSDARNSGSQGPWRIFVSALTQTMIRIEKGGMSYPIF